MKSKVDIPYNNSPTLDKRRAYMAEEKKESKGSNIVQIRLSDKQKEELQKKAEEVGLPMTQYIVYLITSDLKQK